MNLSQILFLAILAAFLYYTYKVKSILVNRVIFLMLGAAGVFMILFPGVTSDMAHLVGVGQHGPHHVFIHAQFAVPVRVCHVNPEKTGAENHPDCQELCDR